MQYKLRALQGAAALLTVTFVIAAQAQVPAPTQNLAGGNSSRLNAARAQQATNDKIITGQMKNKQGQPVGGILVAILRLPLSEGNEPVRATTDKLGRFAFRNLSDGNYLMMIASPDHRYPDTIRNETITLSSARKQVNISHILSPGAVVTGVVSDKRTGVTLPGITVMGGKAGVNGRADMFTNEAVTDAQGRYRLRILPGNVAVAISDQAEGAPVRGDLQYKTVREGGKLTLDFAVSIQPRLTFLGPDNKPVADASLLFIAKESVNGTPSVLVGKTNALGQSNLDFLQSGYLRARKGDLFVAAEFQYSPISGRFLTNTAEQEASFRAGSVRLRMTPSAPAYLTGRVVDEAGTPIPNAILHAEAHDSKNGRLRDESSFRSDAEGRFHLPLALDGVYTLKARADGYSVVNPVTDAEPYQPRKGDDKNVGKVVLTRAEGVVDGRVINNDGKGAAGMLVTLRGGKTGFAATVTDAEGSFRVSNVVPNEPLEMHVREGFVDADGCAGVFTSSKVWIRSGVIAQKPQPQSVNPAASLEIVLSPADQNKPLPASSL